jgi:exosortase
MKIETDKIISHLKQHRYIYIVVALLTFLNINIFSDLISDWMRDDNYSHGFFIIPIAVYLLYRQRNEISFPVKPDKLGLLVLLIGTIGLIFGTAASEFFTTRLGLVMMFTGITMYYLGRDNFKKVWFPFFFLLFMIPVPAIIYYAATLPMQLFASKVSVFLLKFIGVPVARNGNIIILPDYSLEVAEACSGLRSLVTLLALGALYAFLQLPGRVLPVILFIATIPIAIVTNIFRVFITAVGAHAISIEVAEGFLHEFSGMIVFLTALIIMLILGAILKWIRKRFTSSSA